MPELAPLTPEDRDMAARTLVGEARGEPPEGQAAVAWVIRNRASWDTLHSGHPEHEWWGTTVALVCRHPAQFSCWNAADPNLPLIRDMAADDPRYLQALAVVRGVFGGGISDPTASIGGATHYRVRATHASWDAAAAGKPSLTFGHQVFYCLGPQG